MAESPRKKAKREQTVPHPADARGLRGLQVAYPVPEQPTIEVCVFIIFMRLQINQK
jgi:hypothetical protein